MSYSKKPPERAGTLPEFFELALELVQFHGVDFCVGWEKKAAMIADRSARRGAAAPSGDRVIGEHVVDEKLQAPLALVLVDIQPINQPRAP